MKLKPEMLKDSIFNFKIINNYGEGDLIEIAAVGIGEMDKRLADVARTIESVKKRDYFDARMGLKIRNYWRCYHNDIHSLRTIIKNLLEGLIKTSGTINPDKKKDFIETWGYLADLRKKDLQDIFNDQLLFDRIVKIESEKDIADFNNLLRNYIIKLLLQLSEKIKTRLRATIGQLKEINHEPEKCMVAELKLLRFSVN